MQEILAKALAGGIVTIIVFGLHHVWIRWKISKMTDREKAALLEEALSEAGPERGELVTVRRGAMAGKRGRVVRKDAKTITLADSNGREKTISREDL